MIDIDAMIQKEIEKWLCKNAIIIISIIKNSGYKQSAI